MNNRKKEIIYVSVILGIILTANLIYFFHYKKNIQTDYYYLPDDESSENFGKPIVIVALHKEMSSEDPYFLRLGLMRSNNSELTFTYLEPWKTNEADNKFLYIGNFTSQVQNPEFYGEIVVGEPYKFFLHFRSWYSEPFILNEDGYFEWA